MLMMLYTFAVSYLLIKLIGYVKFKRFMAKFNKRERKYKDLNASMYVTFKTPAAPVSQGLPPGIKLREPQVDAYKAEMAAYHARLAAHRANRPPYPAGRSPVKVGKPNHLRLVK